ncbi:MAG TPA: FtsX-like permease family protein [Candidatus Binatia bacterium]|jgi:putative ABC transport system permease protein|nr:FtsX-like permease family protein [Candidatus Binatia bacterium]
MLAQAIRELRRRRLRSMLTAGGIAIGVATLVLLGALSEKVGRLVQGGRDFAAGQITVSGTGGSASSGMSRAGLIAGEQLAAVRAVAGVDVVAPIIVFPVAETPASLPFTLMPLVFGVDVALLEHNQVAPPPRIREGRFVEGPDEVVLGSQVARHFGAGLGATITVRKHDFTVVGLLESTLTGPDSFVMMQFPTAQRLLIDTEPLLRKLVMVPGASVLPIATAAAVFWKTGEDPEAVAARIREQVPGISVMSPGEAAAQIDRALGVLNGIILGSGLIALLVASLAVANTMFTAVVERRREIGLRRVIGATRRQVVGQLLLEATILGLLGTAVGFGVGAATAGALNAVTERLGAPIFLVTMRLALVTALAPPVMAALAGLWPAWQAARLPPTEAIRYA